MRFDWHEAKRQRTLAERNIDFAAMAACFDDPRRMIRRDLRKDYGEQRFNLLGVLKGRLFHVTFTLRDDTIWVISARKANKREQKAYDQE
jgi:uncharacterized protein